MILITFALPHESGRFLPKLEDKHWIQRGALPLLTGSFEGRQISVLHTGVGPERARSSCEVFLTQHQPELLIAAGYAGGLDGRLATGDLILAENFTDPSLLALAREVSDGKAFPGQLTTQSQVAETAGAKKKLAKDTGAIAVDMETEAIYKQALLFKVPMLSVRAISDPVGTAMPIPVNIWFDAINQKPRVIPLLTHLAINPSKIPAFASFVRGTSLARNELTRFLVGFLKRH